MEEKELVGDVRKKEWILGGVEVKKVGEKWRCRAHITKTRSPCVVGSAAGIGESRYGGIRFDV